eukprot:CFRG3976T1
MGRKNVKDVWTSEETWKAIVLAEDFSDRFAPVTHQIQKSLIPVANIPLLEYVLECLSAAGVVEVYICVKSKADQVDQFIKGSRWAKQEQTGVIVNVLTAGESLCQGDVMRHLYGHGVIRSNFILIDGDVISNMRFNEAMREHTERVKKDSRNVMTTVLKEVHPTHHSRSVQEGLVTCMAPESGELLDYRPVRSSKKHSIGVSTEVFDSTPSLTVRSDLVDPHVYVCSPLVLELFCDNFDYQDMGDFIRGLLDDDVQGNRIFTHIVSAEYCTRVSNWHTYAAASIDVLQRWAYPCVPDNSLMTNSQYKYGRGSVYKDTTAKLSRSVHTGRNSAVGAHTSIASECRIDKTVIGRSCDIGEGCVLKDVYVWNDVVIGRGCIINHAIVCSGAVLGDNVVLQKGTVIGPGVRVGDNVTIKPNTVLTVLPKETDSGDDFFNSDDEGEKSTDSDAGVGLLSVTQQKSILEIKTGVLDTRRRSHSFSSRNLLGASGLGREWDPKDKEDDSDSEDEAVYEYPGGEGAYGCGNDSGSCTETDGSESDDYDYEEADQDNKGEAFYKEVLESVRRAVAEKLDMDNVVVEINASKHAYNVTPAYVLETVVRATLEDGLNLSGNSLLNHVLTVTKTCLGLLKNYIRTSADYITTLDVFEDYGETHTAFIPCLQKILTLYYKEDLLDEEAIIQWYNDPIAMENEVQIKMRQQCKDLVEWLEDAEEESDSDEDESDSE